MADIKQAAKWLGDGQRVRRTGSEDVAWVEDYKHKGPMLWFGDEFSRYRFEPSIADLLAEDWEIAERGVE